MNQKLTKITLLVVMMAMATSLSACAKKTEESQKKVKKQVSIQTIQKQQSVTTTLSVSGTIIPKQYSAIRSLVPGTLEYIATVGTEVSSGTPLFRIRDDSIENSHFNALQNYQQTLVITKERVSQSELNLNGAQARFELAEKNLESTIKQTDQTLKNAKDSGVVAYNSSYNTLKQFFNFISEGVIQNFDYRYKDLVTTDQTLRGEAEIKFDDAAKAFLELKPLTDVDSLDEDLTKMNEVLNKTKTLSDLTTLLLQTALGGVVNLESDKTVINGYQTQINSQTTAILNAQNALRNTIINNDLTVNQSKNQLELAKIELNNALIGLENVKNSAELEKTIAQTQLDNTAYSFSNLSLGSPFKGTVISNEVQPGQQVSVGQQILELGNLDIVEIKVGVDTEFGRSLKQGDEVVINNTYQGIIAAIEPVGSIASGKVGVTVQADNKEGRLVSGEIAEVTFNLVYEEDGLIVIPIKAATIESTNTYVFVAENNQAVKRLVSLGKVFGNQVSVTSGLNEGDQLILRNGVFVAEGDELEIQ